MLFRGGGGWSVHVKTTERCLSFESSLRVLHCTPFVLACMYSMCMQSTCWHACVCQCSTSCALACMEYVYYASTHDDLARIWWWVVGKSLQKFDLDEWRCQLFKKICLDLITQMVEWGKIYLFSYELNITKLIICCPDALFESRAYLAYVRFEESLPLTFDERIKSWHAANNISVYTDPW